MPEQIRVAPAGLRQAAGAHRLVAEYLATVPLSHTEIQASLDSLGPIYGGLREAGRQLLEERRRCYQGQASGHEGMSQGLTAAAASWEQHQSDGAAAFHGLVGEL